MGRGMGYNARNDEIRDNITRMRRAWEAQREDRRSAQVEAPLACHQLRQLRDRGRSGFAREVPQPGGFHPRCVARRALPPLQRTWPPAHRRAGAECIAVVH